MDFAGDIHLAYADFGVAVTHVPAAGGVPTVAMAILDHPSANILMGVAVTDYTLRYPIATFPSIKKGDRITIGRTDYLVRDVPLATDDGLEAVAPLAKQF